MHLEPQQLRELALDQAEASIGEFALRNSGATREAARVALSSLRLARRLEQPDTTRRTFRGRPMPEAHLVSLLGYLRQTTTSVRVSRP